ncbi:MAG: isocitrate/isopropylmalate dehydrogenase family protein [Dehalococcoidia bacterium]|nr:isocitrate/isopropylmalate dehydrogenase family protein [Dehalococcoidia bacterium]
MTDGPAASLRLGVIEGDGIGPEIVRVAVAAADAACLREGLRVDWMPLPGCAAAIASHGTAMPASTIGALANLDGWILGPHDSAAYPPEHRALLNPSGTLRKRFDLFANVRPAMVMPGVPALAQECDLVIVRENTEGFYADRNMYAGAGEFMPTPEVALSVGVFTRPAIERIANVACAMAIRRRRRLTIVHKANVLQATGFFRDICREVAAAYPELAVDDYHVDAMAAYLVRDPARFDVVVTENMFGDILSDLAGELCGSLGLAASINAGEHTAMAQAAHGSAPGIAGRDIANPVAIVLSTAMLIRWLGESHRNAAWTAAADRMDAAVSGVLDAGICTPDLGGTAGTRSFGDAVVARVSEQR